MSAGLDKIHLRNAVILASLAILMTLLAGGSYWVQRTMDGVNQMSGKVLANFSAEMPQIRAIKIRTAQGAYTMVRSGAGWIMPERGNYPIAPEVLSVFAKALSGLTYVSARTSDPAQFARLGVDEPDFGSDSAVVSVKGKDNQLLHSFHIGKKAEAVFIRKVSSNDVFEVDGTLPILTRPARWLDLKVIDVTPETIATVSGQNVGEARYDIVRRPDGGFAPLGGQANVVATLTALTLTKWAPLDVMASSSLTSAPTASLSTSLKTGVTIQVTTYQERDRNWVVLTAATTSEDQTDFVSKLNQRTNGWAFELGTDDFAEFTLSRDAILFGTRAP